jgi:hypothetical protein
MKNLIVFTFPFYFFSNFLQLTDLNKKSESTTISTVSKNSQIVFLFFKIDKTDSGQEKITLQEKKITEGKLKSTLNSDESNAQNGDFIVSLTNANGKEIVKQIVEDPLNPSREVYDKEEISRVKISLQNAEFSVRYSHSAEIQMVKIEKISKSGKQLVFTQRL